MGEIEAESVNPLILRSRSDKLLPLVPSHFPCALKFLCHTYFDTCTVMSLPGSMAPVSGSTEKTPLEAPLTLKLKLMPYFPVFLITMGFATVSTTRTWMTV